MTEHSDAEERGRRGSRPRVLAIVAACLLGIGAAATATAQDPGPTGGGILPTDSGTDTTGTDPIGTDTTGTTTVPGETTTSALTGLSVRLDTGEKADRQDRGFKFRVFVTNHDSRPVTGAVLELLVADELDIESVSDEGSKTLLASGDRFQNYSLGTLTPGQQLKFLVQGDYEETDRGNDGDRFDVKATLRAPDGQVSEDIEQVEFEQHRRNND